MKKMMNWMKAAILICGTSIFMACSLDDDPTPVPQPDLNLPENIIGKWMVEELDGQACPTNLKAVITFLSSTKACFTLVPLPHLGHTTRTLEASMGPTCSIMPP